MTDQVRERATMALALAQERDPAAYDIDYVPFAEDVIALLAEKKRLERTVELVRRMADNGPYEGTTPEQVLSTIATFIDKRHPPALAGDAATEEQT